MSADVTPLSDEETERLLAQLRPKQPFTRNEHEDLREMLAEWKYNSKRSEDFRKRFPLIVAAVSVIGTVVTVAISILVNFFHTSGKP